MILAYQVDMASDVRVLENILEAGVLTKSKSAKITANRCFSDTSFGFCSCMTSTISFCCGPLMRWQGSYILGVLVGEHHVLERCFLSRPYT